MKKSISILFALFLFVGSSFSQEESHFSKRNVVKISPVEFGKAEFHLAYEHYFGERSSSIIISPSIILKDNVRESKEGFQIMGQYRFYLSHINSTNGNDFLGLHNVGFYGGVYGLYLDYQEDYISGWYNMETMEYLEGTFHKDISSIEGGALLGMQVDITKRIVFDFYVGGGVRRTDLVDTRSEIQNPTDYYDDRGIFDPEYQGVKPKIGFQVGITF